MKKFNIGGSGFRGLGLRPSGFDPTGRIRRFWVQRFKGSPVKFASLHIFDIFNGASRVQKFNGSRLR
jgi:hypothetical protein